MRQPLPRPRRSAQVEDRRPIPTSSSMAASTASLVSVAWRLSQWARGPGHTRRMRARSAPSLRSGWVIGTLRADTARSGADSRALRSRKTVARRRRQPWDSHGGNHSRTSGSPRRTADKPGRRTTPRHGRRRVSRSRALCKSPRGGPYCGAAPLFGSARAARGRRRNAAGGARGFLVRAKILFSHLDVTARGSSPRRARAAYRYNVGAVLQKPCFFENAASSSKRWTGSYRATMGPAESNGAFRQCPEPRYRFDRMGRVAFASGRSGETPRPRADRSSAGSASRGAVDLANAHENGLPERQP